MPFLDTLTTGYLLKVPQDIYIQHNIENKETKEKDSFVTIGKLDPGFLMSRSLNLNADMVGNVHRKEQLEGSPYIEKIKIYLFTKFSTLG